MEDLQPKKPSKIANSNESTATKIRDSTDGGQEVCGINSYSTPLISNEFSANAIASSQEVQIDLTATCSTNQASTEHANDSITNVTEHSTVGTQTSHLDISSSGIQVLINSERDLNKTETEAPENMVTNEIQSSTELACPSTQLSALSEGNPPTESESTNENLTISLEKHRTVLSDRGRMEEACSSANVACQTTREEITLMETACAQGMNARQCRRCGAPGKEVERLKQRIAELEEKVLTTETTVIWQSVMMKCLKFEINEQ